MNEPLRNNWRVEEDSGTSPHDQIKARVNAEDIYTYCKGYPLIKSETITGRAGKPIPEHKQNIYKN